MNFGAFLNYFVSYFQTLYHFLDSIRPFSDFPQISMFWIFASLILTSLAWQLFPSELMDNFDENDE